VGRLVIGTATLCLILFPAQLQARTIFVSPQGGEFSSIQAAVEAAGPGDVVVVDGGRYREHVVVKVPGLRLVGRGGPVIENSGSTHTVELLANGVELSGFTVVGTGDDLMHNASCVHIKGDRITIRDNRLLEARFGIFVEGGKGHQILGNVIVGKKGLPDDEKGNGIYLWNTEEVTIHGNDISLVRDGIYFDHANRITTINNRIHDLRYGLHYMYSDYNKFEGNLIYRSTVGGVMMYSDYIELNQNQILFNRDTYLSSGLVLLKTKNIEASKNVVVGNYIGIQLDLVYDSEFIKNLFAENDVGVLAFTGGGEVYFTENDFIGNYTSVQPVDGPIDGVIWAKEGRGNYWSDYLGYDLDLDGVGDVPHHLSGAFEELQRLRPLARLYLFSLGAKALASAEKVFPIIFSQPTVDPAPLMRPTSVARVALETQRKATKPSPAAGVLMLGLGILLALLVGRQARPRGIGGRFRRRKR